VRSPVEHEPRLSIHGQKLVGVGKIGPLKTFGAADFPANSVLFCSGMALFCSKGCDIYWIFATNFRAGISNQTAGGLAGMHCVTVRCGQNLILSSSPRIWERNDDNHGEAEAAPREADD